VKLLKKFIALWKDYRYGQYTDKHGIPVQRITQQFSAFGKVRVRLTPYAIAAGYRWHPRIPMVCTLESLTKMAYRGALARSRATLGRLVGQWQKSH
jgi:hypothetical protein